MSQFKVGDRVAEEIERFNPEEDDTAYGVVEAISSNETYLVKWDSNWRKPEYLSSEYLMSEADAIAKVSALEAEFNLMQDKIIEKMNVAAQSIREANEIVRAHGFDLPSLYDARRPLYKAMSEAGWSTSSLHC